MEGTLSSLAAARSLSSLCAIAGTKGCFDVGSSPCFSVGRMGGNLEPSQLSGLLLWFDTGTVNRSGTDLISWPDLSGGGHHATQVDPTKRADVGLVVQNGYPVITNNGTVDNYLYFDVTVDDFDCFVVCKGTADNTELIANVSVNRQLFRINGPSSTLTSFDGFQSWTSQSVPTPMSNFSVLEISRQSGAVAFWQNNSTVSGSIDFGVAGGPYAINGLWNQAGNIQPSCSVLAVLLYNRRLATDERTAVTAYLRDRFAI